MDSPAGGKAAGGVVVVTDGAHGLGRETSERLARLGYAVVMSYAHDQRAAETIVEAILAGGGTAVAVRAEATDELDVDRLFGETVELFGVVDAVVHAAPDQRASFVVNQQAARRVRPGGAVVNLGPAVTIAAPTRALAAELRDRDISVNAVAADVDQTYSSGQIANIVAYLLSDDGHAITGQVIEPDNHPGVA
jgi:3-oxoacyl-[acyl-carrier protein] reductase